MQKAEISWRSRAVLFAWTEKQVPQPTCKPGVGAVLFLRCFRQCPCGGLANRAEQFATSSFKVPQAAWQPQRGRNCNEGLWSQVAGCSAKLQHAWVEIVQKSFKLQGANLEGSLLTFLENHLGADLLNAEAGSFRLGAGFAKFIAAKACLLYLAAAALSDPLRPETLWFPLSALKGWSCSPACDPVTCKELCVFFVVMVNLRCLCCKTRASGIERQLLFAFSHTQQPYRILKDDRAGSFL